jgi:RHS repeat-associated protein
MTVPSGTNAGTYFYCYDGNGNVVALVNAATGAIAANYEYGPFGELIRATGPMSKLNPFMFSTKFYDWETGLSYYGYRYYNPSTGRWLSRDPMREPGFELLRRAKTRRRWVNPNPYAFVYNNSVNDIDLLGLTAVTDIPIEITIEIEDGISLQQIAEDYGLTLEEVSQMAMQIAVATAVDQIAKNFANNAKGNDPCAKARSAVKQAQKAIKSLMQNIQEHQQWINDPTSYDGGGVISPGDPNIPRWIQDWQGDIAKNQTTLGYTQQALSLLEKVVDVACRCWYKPWTWF